MINWLIEWSLRNRVLVILIYVGIMVAGYWALVRTPIDAIPDLSDNQIIVFSDWPGRSPQEVEDQVTYPIVSNLQGLPGVRAVRASSAFSFSMINVIFEDNIELYWARTRVSERLNSLSGSLPTGVTPMIGPDATGVGQVFWYTLESDSLDLRELRSLQDWYVRYQLNSVEGVSEVASVGGFVQQYQINVDPDRLRARGLNLSNVIDSVGRSNTNVGGNVVEQGGEWTVVRGIGLISGLEDVERIVIGSDGGAPIYVRDIGNVEIGDAFRTGSLDKNGKEAVGGVVVARYGTSAIEVIDAVKRKIEELGPGLPEGVRIVPFYDRSDLIYRAANTLRNALIQELILVTLANLIFLAHFRSVFVVTVPLPIAVLTSFLFMYFAGVTSNIMSLAGIAIAISDLVDAGIVVTENSYRAIEKKRIDTSDRKAVVAVVLESTKMVGRPIFSSIAIIIIAFIPVFALSGQEGKLFHPLAYTKTFAMIATAFMAITLVPVLCSYFLKGKLKAEASNPIMKRLTGVYEPVLDWSLRNRALSVGLALAVFLSSLFVASRLGSEFMPPLNEGDLMYMPVTDPSVSLDEATRVLSKQDQIILGFPEVKMVVGKAGRAETSTDPSPINMNETVIQLKPESQWRDGMTRERLVAEMDAALQMPGVTNIWTQPIINRIEMLATGIRSQVGIKIFGDDIKQLEQSARDIATVIRKIDGAADVYAEQITGAAYLDIDIDRDSAARYGIDIATIQETIEVGIGEAVAGTTIEGRKRFPIRVRFSDEFRGSPEAIGNIPVTSPEGAPIPLSELARISKVDGPAMIQSENGLLRGTVLLSVRGRDIGSFVDEANEKIKGEVRLPAGYYFNWSGQYENQERARKTLTLVIPLVILIIFATLYLTYRSFLEAAHVLLAVPFALSGGFLLIWMLEYNFSVAVWVGFIALFGAAVQTTIVMVVYLDEAVRKRETEGQLDEVGLLDAVKEGALLRLRPKVMTVTTILFGLAPIMWSTSAGSEVMKPLAAPVFGGMVSSLIHVLVITPVIFYWIRLWELRRRNANATE
jgi:Cu(I)/Ag(I) efflux system membrane protein CusA/SilA